MRPKFIVYCLAAICLAFATKGLVLTENIQNTLKENARQSESSIMEIGMCFDWYGVIIVNSVVKTSHGVMTPAEMVETLEQERVYKDEYLAAYKKDITPNIATIYTGPPDVFFNFKYGKLDWRSLDFKFKTLKKNKIQECVQINFPNDHKFTRKVEIKHVTKQKSKFSTISYEFPKSKGDPYYPINNKKNVTLFKKYKRLIKKLEKKNIFFEGRLASYRYLNMDEVIEAALNLFKKLKNKYN